MWYVHYRRNKFVELCVSKRGADNPKFRSWYTFGPFDTRHEAWDHVKHMADFLNKDRRDC